MSNRMYKNKTKKPVVNKKIAQIKKAIKKDTKELTAIQEKSLLIIVDHDSTDISFDNKIYNDVMKLKLDKDLVIGFLIKHIRNLERDIY